MVKAHPTVMPPDTESDEEHKATTAYPESPGEHTQMQARKPNTCTKATRHMYNQPDMYSTQNRQINTKALIHWHLNTHRHWHGIKKHSKPWTNTYTDPLVLPGTATRIKHITVSSEINPVPNRYSHFSVHF